MATKEKSSGSESKSDPTVMTAAQEKKVEAADEKEAKRIAKGGAKKPEKSLGPAKHVGHAPLVDVNTPADNEAEIGHFCRIVRGDYEGEFAVLMEDVPESEQVIVRLQRVPGSLVSVKYADLVQDSPYSTTTL